MPQSSVLALLTAVVILQAPQAQDSLDFRVSYAKRKGDIASEVPDPAIQKCMDLVMKKVRLDFKSNSDPAELTRIAGYFSQTVTNEEVFSTDFGSIGVEVSWATDRVAIGVRMGEVARLGVFKRANGAPIAVPNQLAWSYRYQTLPMFAPGGTLIVNGQGIQDAGVRYGYRVWFLKPGDAGYAIGRQLKGIWTLNEEASNLGVENLSCTVRTIDEPKAFVTDNVTRLFERETIYDLGEWPPRVRLETRGHEAVRAVDEWMAASMKSGTTPMRQDFVKSYGKEPKMLEGFEERVLSADTFEVVLELEKRYVFTVQAAKMKMNVLSFRVG